MNLLILSLRALHESDYMYKHYLELTNFEYVYASWYSEVTEEIDSEEAEEEQLDDQIAQIKQAKQQELKRWE